MVKWIIRWAYGCIWCLVWKHHYNPILESIDFNSSSNTWAGAHIWHSSEGSSMNARARIKVITKRLDRCWPTSKRKRLNRIGIHSYRQPYRGLDSTVAWSENVHFRGNESKISRRFPASRLICCRVRKRSQCCHQRLIYDGLIRQLSMKTFRSCFMHA